ncbi:MAG: LPS-assembly protein LptD [Gemmatimonadaceae bacterium]|nr:LPS-assembly protein LptD [Gemmatimonadaceae bacterium]
MQLALPALLAAGASTAGAQVRPDIGRPAPAARDTTPRTPGTGADSIRRVEWVAEDSVARALLGRPGYTFTRYQGPIVTFDALTRAIDLFIGLGDTTGVAVQRGEELIVADTAIRYNEETGRAVATGRVYIREGRTELTGIGGEYNLRERSVTIRGGRTTFETEESWIVSADPLKIQEVDSSEGQGHNVFGRSGTLTSCTDTTHSGFPHYHFAFGEVKRTVGRTMVARPAVLYIEDIPVIWLPFVFQDMREGRRSGLMTPRIGVTDFVRNSPSYRRNVENLGYYWSINDYMDADATIDWLSGTGRGANEAPGWTRYNADWRYRWIDRFLSGGLASSYTRQGDGVKNLAVSWNHNQEFTRHRSLRANVNWMQNTTVQRETRVDPFAVLATINSSVNLQDRIGPAAVALGGSRKQFSGRAEVEQTFPTLSVTTGTLNLRPWLNWTPSFQFNEQRRTDITQASQLGALLREQSGQLVADTVGNDERRTSASFDTPLEIFGFSLRNAFRFAEREVTFPQVIKVVSADTTLPEVDRIFARTYISEVTWDPSFSLPAFAQGTWNLTPSLGFANVNPGPFMVRSHYSGGRWIRQTKRPTAGVSISPTFYGLFPGFAGFSRFRHAVTTSLSYTFAPRAGVSDEFLLAQNESPRNYIGALSQNQLSLTLGTNIEGKGRPAAGDTSATVESAPKVRVLSLNFTPLSYDVSRYMKYRDDGAPNALVRGLTTSNFGTSIRSDLLPGVDFSLDHSLFQGEVLSDTAVFSPYLTRVGGSFQLNAARNPLIMFARLLGRAVPATNTATAEIVSPADPAEARAAAALPIAGSQGRTAQVVVPPRDGWDASFTFSMSRQRPPSGDANIINFDPELFCEPLRGANPLAYQNCLTRASFTPTPEAPVTSPGAGGAFYRIPPATSIGSNLRFTLTPKWTGTWQTNYDVERNEFASHVVSLQRDLHDWRANFSFTQSPNGSFAFSFFIALKAEPDLKFDYNRATYRREAGR